MCGDDAIDEEKLVLCCGMCCVNCGIYPACDAFGCSGKLGLCCLNAEYCCKPGAPCLLPFGCLGLKVECDGCSFVNCQNHCCCSVITVAIPPNEEVPMVLNLLGLNLYPEMGCCMTQKEVMKR